MKKEIIVTAKTVDEAMSQAYVTHGSEGEISFEILEMPKKGFLGLGSTPAKVKVIIDDGEDDADISSIISDIKAMKVETDKGGDGMNRAHTAEKKPQQKAAPKQNANKANAEKPQQKAAPEQKAAPKKEEKAEKTDAKKETKREEKVAVPQPVKIQEKKPVEVKVDAPVKEAPAKKILTDEEKKQKYQPVSEVEMQFALEFVETVLRDLEIDAETVAVKDGDGDYVGINIIGDSTGALIGHHGETLDAIQYLANLSASRRSPTPNREFLKITVDIESYRAKREETLRSLARRMAAKALKYKRNFVLEPMNPYERRIIHSEIQQIDGVDTHSVGSDENRKVVVTYEGSDRQDRRSRRPRRRGDIGHEAKAPVSEAAAPAAEAPAETAPEAPAEAPKQNGPTVLFDSSNMKSSINADGWKKL